MEVVGQLIDPAIDDRSEAQGVIIGRPFTVVHRTIPWW